MIPLRSRTTDFETVFGASAPLSVEGLSSTCRSRPAQRWSAARSLNVSALNPSWIVVDRIKLLENGVVIEEVEGTSASFTLNASDDAVYNVVAEGDTPMLPVTSTTPWALSAPIYLDTTGDGWTPPLPPLTLKE